jgi:catechol 2,3-dioxygenase-like lactoylglutathione lyase family enzyme
VGPGPANRFAGTLAALAGQDDAAVVVGEDVSHFKAQRSGVDLHHLAEECEDVVLPVVLTSQGPKAGIAALQLQVNGVIMAKAIFGNHTAVRAPRAERDRIRAFYRDVLGRRIMRELDDKDDFRMGDGFYLAFLYESGDGREVDKGVVYAAEDALSDDDFLKAIFLELAADNVEEMRQKIVASGVKVLEVPDPHLYFQAPGGQVWRLVGINEDLSRYEGTEHGE